MRQRNYPAKRNRGRLKNIEISREAAVVLSELLFRISERDKYFVDISEQYVLWTTAAQLDRSLDEPFRRDHRDVLEKKPRKRKK